MIKKEGNFLEKHVEKIVLAIAGAVSLWLIFSFVIVGFNKIDVGRGQQLGPLQIDDYILNNQAEQLKIALNKQPVPKEKYVSKMNGYLQMLDSALALNDGLYPPLPGKVELKTVQPKYALPTVPDIDRAIAEHIRAVAYMPRTAVDATNPYNSSIAEVNDLDIVTIEFRYNIQNLYRSFRDSFSGLNLPEQWRDPTLAEPVFAAVQLQRQEQNDDGTWSEWSDVPRSKIDKDRKLFDIIEDINTLPPGGLKVRMLDFKDKAVQVNLLQPDYYRVASANEEWFPPSLHSDYRKIRDEIDNRQKREAKQAELEMKKTMAPARAGGGAADMDTLRAMRGGGGAYGYPTPVTTTTTTTDEQAFSKLYKEFEKISITEKTDLSKLTSELAIWAFDDTVKPGATCRYRIRIGVFNPIAGSDKFVDPNDPLKDKVILWSGFNQPDAVVKIPEKMYLFAKERVTVTVCKYNLGSWYSSDFKVMPGDTIGKAVKNEPDSSSTEAALESFRFGTTSAPKEIDYSTGAVLVDVVDVNDWAGGTRLTQRFYTEMLYSFDDSNIDRMPVGSRFWSSEMTRIWNQIKEAQDQPKKPLIAWMDKGAKRQEQQQLTPMFEGTGDQEALMQMYMRRFQGDQGGYEGPAR